MENININEYLEEANRKAKVFGFDGVIELSDRHGKKLKFTDRQTDKVIHFGAKGYKDRIIYKMLYGKDYANKRAEQYRFRAWPTYTKAPFLSPSSLSWLILW
jgi:hypothetical protein